MNEVKRLLSEIINYEMSKANAHGTEPNKVYQLATQALARLSNTVIGDFSQRVDKTKESKLLPAS